MRVSLKPQDGGRWQVELPGVIRAGIRNEVRIFCFVHSAQGMHILDEIRVSLCVFVDLNTCRKRDSLIYVDSKNILNKRLYEALEPLPDNMEEQSSGSGSVS